MSGSGVGPLGDGFPPPAWAELAPLVDAILDAPPERRAQILADLSGGDPGRRAALERMVAECEREAPLLDRPATERFEVLVQEHAEAPLPEVLSERYRTGRELGRGGMARVYLGRDLKHGREVAIKVLRPDLSASLGHDRFLREIEIAARLRHPNIVPLYDSGEVAGSLYFVMPFEEGPSLGDRLRREGAMPIADALSVLRDIARALGYAHEHGVVHRDVKPDNVMLSGGAAVVTDFGIAKAVSAALTTEGDPALTFTGAAIGTLAYMAPEQAVGDPATDHRADLYSYGCLAYALLTGNPPFHDLPPHQVVAAHMRTVPPLLRVARADVPEQIEQLVARCLEKDPAARPQSAAEVLAVLDQPGAVGTPLRRPRRAAVLAGLAAVAVLGAVAWLQSANRAAPAPITLSVLPFNNTAADSAVDFVVEGLADEVAAALARVPGIQIMSRSGARLYRGQLGVDVIEAGARLNAAYLMTGVVRQVSGRWILSADLARGDDGSSLWTEVFTLDPDQQAGAVATITESLLASLRRQFPGVGITPQIVRARQTANNEAYRFYLRGQERLSRRGRSVKESAELFEQAIREDSTFAQAYSGLSMALSLYPYFQGLPARDVNDRVVAAAQRALSLDPTLAQPHVALGLAHQLAYRWDSAGIEYQRAIQLDDREVEARVQYGRHLIFRARHDAALEQLRIARGLDPASALVLSWVSYAYYLQGRLDSALVESRRAIENDSTNLTSLSLGALIRLQSRRFDEARLLSNQIDSSVSNLLNGFVRARAGDRTGARQMLEDLDRMIPQPWLSHSKRAYTLFGLQDTAQGLDALERATDAGEIWPALYGPADPLYASVRGSDRFNALLRRVGLAELAGPARR